MNRLQLELDRLYGPGTAPANDAAKSADAPPPRGVRVLMLALSLPAGWEQLSAAWRGVQLDLDLPAPAIAVSGDESLQLWFSLAQPRSPADGERFLRGLRARYLPEVAPAQVRWFADAAGLPPLPPAAAGPDRWSAFVSPDLAAVFAESPWLDVAPTDDGQATLLRAVEPMSQAAFEAALGAIDGDERRASASAASPGLAAAPPAGREADDPARFLLRVMNDESAPLALRIEAAKALLPGAGRA